MANLQRMLGTLLASRMAGRGGMGGALGTAAMMGVGGLGGKAGLAAMGYLAYRSYRDKQAAATRSTGNDEQASTNRQGGALSGLLDSIAGEGQSGFSAIRDRIGNALNPGQDRPEEAETAEVRVSDDKALLLIRGMIAAAHSDGEISPEERSRILAQLDQDGAEPEDRRLIEKEMRAPKPLDDLLRHVNDPETAQQFYLASRAAVGGESRAQTSYLAYLRDRLGLSEEDAAEVEQMAQPE